ncbi:alpha/beta hydrolase [Mucilaginibacter sp.]|uniref:alpha/beta hydrolase n=1 Tax=Mucilaginibacter sp. TaxID=1882438 RepID=UPI003D139DE2
MSKIFLIPGLGADTRIYNNLDFYDHDVTCVDWILPHQTDTLTTYAQKLVYQYNITPKSIVVGNSLGGMLAVEIAKILTLQKVILISSIKTINEAPGYFSLFKNLPVYKLISPKLFSSMEFLIRFAFGKMNDADSWLFNDMLKNSSPVFMKWAMGAILHWDNQIVPPNLVHITGDHDHVFNYRKIKDAIIVKGGTHIMIFDKAKEINKLLKKILKK